MTLYSISYIIKSIFIIINITIINTNSFLIVRQLLFKQYEILYYKMKIGVMLYVLFLLNNKYFNDLGAG